MPDTFRFKQEPDWILGRTSVILCAEDFICLLRLAEKWLNSDGPTAFKHSTSSVKPLMHDIVEAKIEAEEDSMLDQLSAVSKILNSAEGQKLGKSPLDFLSKELSKFTSSKTIFTTSQLLPKTAVASEFHKACDNVPNVLVIIKSGQYIAGGYTEVPFESRNYSKHSKQHFKPNLDMRTFLFSANRKKTYMLIDKLKALNCRNDKGPSFGLSGISISSNYSEYRSCSDNIFRADSSFYTPNSKVGELFSASYFAVDEYEVYKLE